MQQNIMVVHGGGGGGPLECLPGQGVLGVGEGGSGGGGVGEEEGGAKRIWQ